MKVSHTWLQKYFDTQIPTPEKLAELFTFHSFEVEGVEHINGDAVIDVKVLPDRAHYALSHKGIAQEVAALTGCAIREKKGAEFSISEVRPLTISVQDETFCPRYIGRVIENVTIGNSPESIKSLLEAVGSRAINSVVDATNYTMLDLGQPLHAFDADKVEGGITVRYAKEGETIVTLDGKEVSLTVDDSVIADEKGPLAIAGVKGGKRAEVTTSTKNIILESANFKAAAVRKTSSRVGIRNESSKRYENAITPELTAIAMDQVTDMILATSENARVGKTIDVYSSPVSEHVISITKERISEALGANLSDDEIISLLKKQNINVEKREDVLDVEVPHHRLDLTIPEDVVEEVGRMYGYDKIPSILPKQTAGNIYTLNKTFYYSEKIKTVLTENGFSEVYLYSLTNKGDYEVVYPLASDKSFLRKNLAHGIEKALELNAQNAPLLGLEKINIFEIGTVFTKEEEYTALSIGVKHTVKKKGESADVDVEQMLKLVFEKIGSDFDVSKLSIKNGIVEINLTRIVDMLPEVTEVELFPPLKEVVYKPYSSYPFVLRDVAVFVPEDCEMREVEAIVLKNAGPLLVRHELFDVFTKTFPDGASKTSYAFHLVFQSYERTLTDTDVTPVMDKIYSEMTNKGWQIR